MFLKKPNSVAQLVAPEIEDNRMKGYLNSNDLKESSLEESNKMIGSKSSMGLLKKNKNRFSNNNIGTPENLVDY